MTGRKQGHYSQAARLIRLLDKLRIHYRGIAKEQLAEDLAITARQLNRDLQALAEAGFETDSPKLPGQPVRVRLSEERVSKVIRLTRRQRYTLLAMLRIFDPLEGTPLHEDVQRIFTEVADSLPTEQRRELYGYGQRFVCLPDGGRKQYASKGDVLDGLLTGVLRNLRVQYAYQSRRRTSRGVLEPYALVVYRNGLYVIGAALEDGAPGPLRSWAVERFKSAEHLRKQRFELPEGFNVDDHFEGAFGIFVGAEQEETEVEVEFDASVSDLVRSRVWQEGQKLKKLKGGGTVLSFRVKDTTQVLPWVYEWGPRARLIKPVALVERVREELEEWSAMYG